MDARNKTCGANAEPEEARNMLAVRLFDFCVQFAHRMCDERKQLLTHHFRASSVLESERQKNKLCQIVCVLTNFTAVMILYFFFFGLAGIYRTLSSA